MEDGRKPFEPIGSQPRWKILYDLVAGRPIGTEITYGEARDALGGVDRQTAISAMYTAKRHLENDGERSVRNVMRFGWIVMKPDEEIAEAETRRKRAHRRVRAGIRIVRSVNTRRGELTQFDRQRLDYEDRSLSMLADIMSRKTASLADLVKKYQLPEGSDTLDRPSE